MSYYLVSIVIPLFCINQAQTPTPKKVLIQGEVIQLGGVLTNQWKIPVDDDMGASAIVLRTKENVFHPILKDARSRGFFMDKRLWNRPMELKAYQYPGLPYLRIVSTFSFMNGKKYRVDYWCEICSISTFEPGPCPCCQDEIRLREIPVLEPGSRP